MGEARNVRRRAGIVLAILLAGLVGYVIGPPIVSAATSQVEIKGFPSGWRANVTANSRRLLVDTEATTAVIPGNLDVSSANYPLGLSKLLSGSVTSGLTEAGVISAINLDNTGATSVTVAISDSDGTLWQGTAGPGQHLNDTFDGGLLFDTLTVAVTGSGATFWIYGYLFGSESSLQRAGDLQPDK
jgi:hypothetical protein